MRMKCCCLGLLAALLLASVSGCKKSATEGAPPLNTDHRPAITNQPSTPPIARIHWLGKKQIAAQKTSKYFMSIWNLPDATKLETQTLDKLALAFAGAGVQSAGGSNQLSATSSGSQITNLVSRLRPLLDDLVREESYLEIQQATDQPAELALAVRLDGPRADLWTANLSAVIGSLTNAQPLPAPASRQSWKLPPSHLLSPNSQLPPQFDLARIGEWTVLGLASETNALLADLCHRIRVDHTPVLAATGTNSSFQVDPVTRKVSPALAGPAATNYLLTLDLDLRRVSSALSLGWNLSDAWPRISATWTGTGDLIRTVGELTFPQPLDLQLEPWNIPTNLIHQPMLSFSAVRGLRSWLARQNWMQQFQVDPVPDQFCAWASTATPMLAFVAAPMTNAVSLLHTFGPRFETEMNPWITNNAFGDLEYSNTPVALTWSGIPMITPTIDTTSTSGSSFLMGRLGPAPASSGKPAPPELFAQLTARPNLVYYDWEITQPKLTQWIFIGQTARLAFRLPQMPPQSAAFAFLLAVAPKLGNTGTQVVQDGPASLSFVRNSHSGFTGVELHFLADWLESPAFPRGLHSLLAPKPVRKVPPRLGTNSVPSKPMPAPGLPRPTSVVPPR